MSFSSYWEGIHLLVLVLLVTSVVQLYLYIQSSWLGRCLGTGSVSLHQILSLVVLQVLSYNFPGLPVEKGASCCGSVPLPQCLHDCCGFHAWASRGVSLLLLLKKADVCEPGRGWQKPFSAFLLLQAEVLYHALLLPQWSWVCFLTSCGECLFLETLDNESHSQLLPPVSGPGAWSAHGFSSALCWVFWVLETFICLIL